MESSGPLLLSIETSCDDTAAAVVRGRELLSSVISSQFGHDRYGGIVPEVASRAHQQMIVPVVERALEEGGISRKELAGIVVTEGPGLAGSLMVGVSFAKAMALGLNVPLVGVNHIEGHIFSVFTEREGPDFPYLCLIVSGGHTQLMVIDEPMKYRLLGRTRDDAAGEAFDKIAKLLELGYPGGPEIDRLARSGDPSYHRFPRSRPGKYDFSFSGLKTSVLYFLNQMSAPERKSLYEKYLPDLCAAVQAAIVDALLAAVEDALEEYQVKDLAIVGGVSANSGLRGSSETIARRRGVHLHLPDLRFCTDNAAMIATAGSVKFLRGIRSPLTLSADPSLSL